jgi:hypothetical protein
MSDPSRIPPPRLQANARELDAWVKWAEQPPAPPRDMQRDWAERLDRCHQVDQSKMPAWQDPRNTQAVFADGLNYCRQFDQTKMPPWRDRRGQ